MKGVAAVGSNKKLIHFQVHQPHFDRRIVNLGTVQGVLKESTLPQRFEYMFYEYEIGSNCVFSPQMQSTKHKSVWSKPNPTSNSMQVELRLGNCSHLINNTTQHFSATSRQARKLRIGMLTLLTNTRFSRCYGR